MKKKRIVVTVFAVLLMLALIFLSAAAPLFAFRMYDTTLLSTPLPRRRLDSRLSDQGADNYLVRTLHQRAESLQKNGELFYSAMSVSKEDLPDTFFGYITTLENHAIITPEFGFEIAALCYSQDITVSWRIDSSGVCLYQIFSTDPNTYITAANIEVEPLVDKVIRFWVVMSDTVSYYEAETGFSPLDVFHAEPFFHLQNYLSYLGLDNFQDWAAVDEYCLLSNKAQLQISAEATENTFFIAATPIL